MDLWRDACADHFDGLHQFRVRQGSRIHLKRNPGDTAQRLAMTHYLLGHFVRTSNQQ